MLSLSGRTISTSGVTGPFRAFPKSLSVDFGGLNHPQVLSLSQQQTGSVAQTTVSVGGSNAQDRYAAVSQLDSGFCDTSSTTGGKITFKMLLLFTWTNQRKQETQREGVGKTEESGERETNSAILP